MVSLWRFKFPVMEQQIILYIRQQYIHYVQQDVYSRICEDTSIFIFLTTEWFFNVY
jgi:hypothetical protein